MDEEPAPPAPRPNTLLATLREHRFYGATVGYLVAAWIVLQVSAIVLPGFGAPPWVLRALMILLALGLGATLLAMWGKDRRTLGLPLVPRAVAGKLAWVLTAFLPAASVTAFFLLHPLDRPTPAPAAPAVAPVDPMEKSVAVLPFENRSTEKENAFFADGVQDEVLTDLSKVVDLKVISRTSVMQYKDASRNLREIGKTLGVAYVVEGSVQRAGNRIRVTAQLIDARTDGHKWSEHYDRDLADIFAIQSEIAQAIAGQLQVVISPQTHAAMMEVPTRDEQAYQLYLRALAGYGASNLDASNIRLVSERTLGLLRQATARDPSFVRALILLIDAQSLLYFYFDQTPATAEAVRAASETIARVRPGSAEASLAAGFYDYRVRRDYPRAAQEFADATRLSPNDARAWHSLAAVVRRQGRWEDALAALRRAMELDPEGNESFYTCLELLRALGRSREEETLLDSRLAAHPQDTLLHEQRVEFLLESRADARAARAELSYLPQDNDPDGVAAYAHLYCDFADRDTAAIARDLARCSLPEISSLPRAFYEGWLALLRRDAPGLTAAFEKVRPDLEARVRDQPNNYIVLFESAVAEAGAGRKENAVGTARRAVEAARHDALALPNMKMGLASVLGMVGEREEALRVLREIAGKPYGPSYGNLRFHPYWEALRGDPDFEALVASLAPKP